MMRRFVLRATLAQRVRTAWFPADNDRIAVADGGFEVLRLIDSARTWQTQDVWRYGHIELINDMGVVLAEMSAKEFANGGI